MEDKIAKQKLNVIVLVDCSKSMAGERIKQVNTALRDVKEKLIEMQGENATVDFYMTLIPFSTEADFLGGQKCVPVEEFSFDGLKCGGRSNLHLGYQKLSEILKKESQGGIMPDFGGIAPILLLMTDGHPSKYPIKEELLSLKKLPWFRVALRYGIAIELNDDKTLKVLREFVDGEGDVIECYDAKILERIIKIIVLTASKVKSKSGSVRTKSSVSIKTNVQMQVQQALAEVDDWEW